MPGAKAPHEEHERFMRRALELAALGRGLVSPNPMVGAVVVRDGVVVGEGWAVAAAYLEQPAVRLVTAGAGHTAIAAELAATPGLRSDDVPDVEIAALAIEHGLVLASRDHGFRRFSRLRVVDPLTGSSA